MSSSESDVLEGLRDRRRRLGLSQMELARRVGVSLLTIQLWERGVGRPKDENLRKLKRVLEEAELAGSVA